MAMIKGELALVGSKMDPSRVLRDILAVRQMENSNPSRLEAPAAQYPTSSHQLRGLANRLFGEINGWRTDPNYYFAPEFLGQCGRGRFVQPHWADHAVYYKAPKPDGRRGLVNAAIVGQPYQMDAIGLSELVASGLKVSLPVNPYASIWYPGVTLFVIVTLPKVEVRLLPEQEVVLPELVPPARHIEHFRRNLPEGLPKSNFAEEILGEGDAR
jgi:hypothetical protein